MRELCETLKEGKEGIREKRSLENKPGGEWQSGRVALNSMSQVPVCRSVTCVHPLVFASKAAEPGQGVCVCKQHPSDITKRFCHGRRKYIRGFELTVVFPD